MAKYTDKKKASNLKWDNNNLDRISIAIPKGQKDVIKAAAAQRGESVNAYIYAAVVQRMERESSPTKDVPAEWPPSANEVTKRLATLSVAEQKRIQALPGSEQYKALGFLPPVEGGSFGNSN